MKNYMYSPNFFYISKIAIQLSLGLYRSLQPFNPALQNMKYLLFFLFLWGIFALLDLDSEFGSGSTYLIESGSNPHPDPKHCTVPE
jgi:hypothetical protein